MPLRQPWDGFSTSAHKKSTKVKKKKRESKQGSEWSGGSAHASRRYKSPRGHERGGGFTSSLSPLAAHSRGAPPKPKRSPQRRAQHAAHPHHARVSPERQLKMQKREELARRFEDYVTRTEIGEAFKCIVQEVLERRSEFEAGKMDIFDYTAGRLRQMDRDRIEAKARAIEEKTRHTQERLKHDRLLQPVELKLKPSRHFRASPQAKQAKQQKKNTAIDPLNTSGSHGRPRKMRTSNSNGNLHASSTEIHPAMRKPDLDDEEEEVLNAYLDKLRKATSPPKERRSKKVRVDEPAAAVVLEEDLERARPRGARGARGQPSLEEEPSMLGSEFTGSDAGYDYDSEGLALVDEPDDYVLLCEASMGGSHVFVEGLCTACFLGEEEYDDLCEEQQGDVCQASMGGAHKFHDGFCVNCLEERSEDANILVVHSDGDDRAATAGTSSFLVGERGGLHLGGGEDDDVAAREFEALEREAAQDGKLITGGVAADNDEVVRPESTSSRPVSGGAEVMEELEEGDDEAKGGDVDGDGGVEHDASISVDASHDAGEEERAVADADADAGAEANASSGAEEQMTVEEDSGARSGGDTPGEALVSQDEQQNDLDDVGGDDVGANEGELTDVDDAAVVAGEVEADESETGGVQTDEGQIADVEPDAQVQDDDVAADNAGGDEGEEGEGGDDVTEPHTAEAAVTEDDAVEAEEAHAEEADEGQADGVEAEGAETLDAGEGEADDAGLQSEDGEAEGAAAAEVKLAATADVERETAADDMKANEPAETASATGEAGAVDAEAEPVKRRRRRRKKSTASVDAAEEEAPAEPSPREVKPDNQEEAPVTKKKRRRKKRPSVVEASEKVPVDASVKVSAANFSANGDQYTLANGAVSNLQGQAPQ